MAKAFQVICQDCDEEYTYYTDTGYKCPYCGSLRKATLKRGTMGVDVEDLEEDDSDG